MAKHNEHPEEQIRQQVAEKTDNVLGIAAIVAIIVLFGIQTTANVLGAAEVKVPDVIWYGLVSAIAKDVVQWFLKGRQ